MSLDVIKCFLSTSNEYLKWQLSQDICTTKHFHQHNDSAVHARKIIFKLPSEQIFSQLFDDKQCLLSLVDGLESFWDLIKRRSFRRFLHPALFHQSQNTWMHSLSFLLGNFRSVERCTSVFDFLHDHCTIHMSRFSLTYVVLSLTLLRKILFYRLLKIIVVVVLNGQYNYLLCHGVC